MINQAFGDLRCPSKAWRPWRRYRGVRTCSSARPSTGRRAAASAVARARGTESSCSGRPRVVRRAARSGREEGRGVQRPQVDRAEDVVGPPEPSGHLVDRRHARNPFRSPAGSRHARVRERSNSTSSARSVSRPARPRGQRTDVPSRRVWHAQFRFLVARRRPPDGRTPALTADGRASAAAGRQRLVRTGSVRHVRGFLAVRPLHRAQFERRHERRALRQRHSGHAEPGQRHDHLRDGARDAGDSARRPAASRGAVTQYNGNSRGHWDGDTLVVETSGFTDKTSIGSGAPNSTSMRTTERLVVSIRT